MSFLVPLLLACADPGPKAPDGEGETADTDGVHSGGPDDTGTPDDTSDTSDTYHSEESAETNCVLATWYTDADHDDYGDPATAEQACEPSVPGAVLEAGDCDDTNPDVHPYAEEICGDGLDNDCDGGGCGPFRSLAAVEADVVITGPERESAFGTAVVVIEDAAGDGLPDLAAGAPGLGPEGYTRSTTWYLDHLETGEVASLGSSIRGTTWGDGFGSALATPGDLDGDGIGELWVASTAESIDGPGSIGLYLFRGPVGPTDYTEADLTLHGGEDHRAGVQLATGDLDGDGWTELLVGHGEGGAVGGGGLWVVPGAGFDTPDLDEAGWRIEGAEQYDELEASAVGDVDGDGVADLLLGGDGVSLDTGRAWLLLGPVSEGATVGDASLEIAGVSREDDTGRAVWILDDLDGDGLSELAVSAPSQPAGTGYGRLSVHPGVGRGVVDTASTWLVVEDDTTSGYLGASAASGDFDGDGRADLAVGSPEARFDTGPGGRVSVFRAPSGGRLDASAADGRIEGQDRAGVGSGMLAADLDGDGLDDLALGTADAEVYGMIYIFHGGAW